MILVIIMIYNINVIVILDTIITFIACIWECLKVSS